MAELTLRVYRMWTESFEDEAARKLLHTHRAKLLHGLADALDVEVRDWGETDSDYPREVVEIVLVLAPVVVPALASIINTWIQSKKIKRVTIKKDGTEIEIEGASPAELKIIKEAMT